MSGPGFDDYDYEKAVAEMLADGALDFNTHHWQDDWPEEARRTWMLCVNCNDLFAWACADSEEVFPEDMASLHDFWTAGKVLGHGYGPSVWACIKRRQIPQKPVADDMRRHGIDLDALAVQHGLRPNWSNGVNRIFNAMVDEGHEPLAIGKSEEFQRRRDEWAAANGYETIKESKTMQTVTMTPIADRVIIQPIAAPEVSKGGIYLPPDAQEKPQEGLIVAVGPGRREDGVLVAPTVKVGDKVLYGKYAGTEIKVEGQQYLIVKESELLVILG